MSSARVRNVLNLVADFSDQERQELHTELNGAFASSAKEWQNEWNCELTSRIAQIENGETELISSEDILADLRVDLSA